MFIYVADEETVYSGTLTPGYMQGGRPSGCVYKLIRPLEDGLSLAAAVAEYGQITYWRTAEGKLR